ncbi:MAG: elongation factor Ts [Treponema sp.]|jgi:elongation factor Ts|nr:elongation factor Ts [Treponema sp.]MBQ1644479.1 elongation factor Ts [Treponema sp.]MBQ1671427.1 elongation factor Ts [Treponema sp.]MBQ1726850.1 elongation factor Ts [Treponema sp.]MBQ1795138.1 elongation factor Ts [Treponema sp.]
MAITAAQVKELREQTGAGMMDCKKALTETNGDFDAAAKLLKEKGLAAVAKRAERVTSEGRIFIRQNGNKIAVVELVCETDFVANNADFISSGEKILDMVFEKGYTEANKELSDVLLDFATRTRENMSLNKVQIIEVPEGASSGIYVHSNFKQAAVVIVKGSTDDKVKEFAKDCCMHLVAFTPAYIKQTDVPQSYIDEQKDIFKKQMEQDPKMASKPENVREGILQGKINKHLAEVCFVDQMFVKDDKKSVNAKLAEIGKEVGASLEFGDISLLVLGK